MPVRNVLVVDDSKSAQVMLRRMLQGFGMTVDAVGSAEEALNYLLDRRPDAIFMDHSMPGMDGLTAVRKIRGDPATAEIPLAMYTSKDEPAYQDEARAAGAVGVLVKPAMPGTLGPLLAQLHAAFDATQIHPSALAPAGESTMVTAEWVGKIALEKAEMVFYDSVESQVLPLINDVIAKLRRDLEAGQDETFGRIAARICEARLAEWQPPPEARDAPQTEAMLRSQMLPLLEERLEIFRREGRADIEELARKVASEVCQNQLHELSERLIRQLSLRFAEATQKAGAVAREVAIDAAREAVSQAASEAATARAGEESAVAAAERTARQLWADAQRDLRRRVYWAAIWAAAVGGGAAVLAHYALR